MTIGLTEILIRSNSVKTKYHNRYCCYTLLWCFLAMGMYDSVMVNCPQCGKEHEFQSKSGDCLLEVYTLENCPDDVIANVNRHSPCKCDCGALFQVDIATRKAVVVNETS
jgi:hypothetical protein